MNKSSALASSLHSSRNYFALDYAGTPAAMQLQYRWMYRRMYETEGVHKTRLQAIHAEYRVFQITMFIRFGINYIHHKVSRESLPDYVAVLQYQQTIAPGKVHVQRSVFYLHLLLTCYAWLRICGQYIYRIWIYELDKGSRCQLTHFCPSLISCFWANTLTMHIKR